jgi:Predicted ATPase (AAA+ superfamily)
MKNISDSLAGRAGIVKLLGMSGREVDSLDYNLPFLPTAEHIGAMEKGRLGFDYRRIIERIHTGGFPEFYENKGNLKDWSDFYSSYFQTYIEKDIKDVLNIQDESAFIKFVKACASLTGQTLNYTTISEICGKDVKTVQKWTSVLESGGLIYLLQPYSNNLNKRLVRTPKLYFLDAGLTCWLLGWNTPDQLINGAMWGRIFETYVVTEILKSYYNDGNFTPPLYYYRDKEKNEIDLVIEIGATLYPVEIKTTSDPVKSMAGAFKYLNGIPDKAAGEGAVVCMAKSPLPLSEKVWMIPADLI